MPRNNGDDDFFATILRETHAPFKEIPEFTNAFMESIREDGVEVDRNAVNLAAILSMQENYCDDSVDYNTKQENAPKINSICLVMPIEKQRHDLLSVSSAEIQKYKNLDLFASDAEEELINSDSDTEGELNEQESIVKLNIALKPLQ